MSLHQKLAQTYPWYQKWHEFSFTPIVHYGVFLTFTFASLIVVLSAINYPAKAAAADVYIAQTAQGSNNGTSCANAYAVTFFNTSANWGSGSGKIGPGTTVHLCGTIASQLTVQGSGTSGNPITILFETNAKISLPYCDNNNGCLNVSGSSYIIVDGGTNGIIENTANGTLLANQQDSIGILASPACANCEYRNLTIQNLYVHPAYSNDTHNAGRVGGFYLNGTGGTTKIHNNTLHDGAGINYIPGASNDNGLQIYNNNIYNENGDINIAGSESSNVLSGAQIYNNHFHDWATADEYGCPGHHDGIHTWGLNGGSVSDLNIYNNLFDGNLGDCATGAVFLEGDNSNVQLYNNVFIPTYTQEHNGIMNVNGSNYQIYNNTIIGPQIGDDVCLGVGVTGTLYLENNLITGCGTPIAVASFNHTVWDYNTYGWANTFYINTPEWYTFSQWKTASGADAHSSYNASVGVDSLGHLQAGSPAIGAGANLTSLGITTLNSDYAGISRPVSAAWDIGAYQSSGGGSGNTVTAASCSYNDVLSAVTAVPSGGTVEIPSGSCTWASTMNITKAMTLEGAGSSSTVISMQNPGKIISVSLSADVPFRISGIGFVFPTNKPSAYMTAVYISGMGLTQVRVDHDAFTKGEGTYGSTDRCMGWPIIIPLRMLVLTIGRGRMTLNGIGRPYRQGPPMLSSLKITRSSWTIIPMKKVRMP